MRPTPAWSEYKYAHSHDKQYPHLNACKRVPVYSCQAVSLHNSHCTAAANYYRVVMPKPTFRVPTRSRAELVLARSGADCKQRLPLGDRCSNNCQKVNKASLVIRPIVWATASGVDLKRSQQFGASCIDVPLQLEGGSVSHNVHSFLSRAPVFDIWLTSHSKQALSKKKKKNPRRMFSTLSKLPF